MMDVSTQALKGSAPRASILARSHHAKQGAAIKSADFGTSPKAGGWPSSWSKAWPLPEQHALT